ncbi:uncharacterized protein LOC108157511 [Drosophila miranda]|uniref:uncharacterized protein LOC108157511 n=1 Tax=Drosophila miranda TaxID=7229 RepID=UPI0007E760CF|nr:uncharacterized protein LOC108157511 [Drosophila miranda]
MSNQTKKTMKKIITSGTNDNRNIFLSKTTEFDKQNVDETTNVPLGQRQYGFIKANKTSTPFPSTHTLDPNLLDNKLKRIQYKAKQSLRDTAFDSDTSSAESDIVEKQLQYNATDSLTVKKMPFELKRKLFDEAEFTVTRGQKLSDLHHPEIDVSNIQKSFNYEAKKLSYKEMEAFCRHMNFKITKGFDAALH